MLLYYVQHKLWSRSLNLLWKGALMLVPKNKEKGGYFWLHARTLKCGKKGTFFISTPWYRAKGYVFLVVLNYVVGLQLRRPTMTFTAIDILCKRCFTFSGYNVLMWSQLEGKIIWKKMYYNYNECPRFVLKGVITQCALLEIGKGVIFLTTKVLVLAKIGGVFFPTNQWKGVYFQCEERAW